MVVWGTCLWTCLWIGIPRSKHLQAQFKVETVAFLPWSKLWVTVTPVEMSPVAMSHSSFEFFWCVLSIDPFDTCLFHSLLSCFEQHLCNHMKIPASMVPPPIVCSSLSGPGPGEEFEEHEGFEVLWAQKMLGADGQEQEISMLLLDWLHLDFEACQRTSDITISAHVRIIKYLSTAKAVFYMFYFWFKDLGLYFWLRFLKNQLVQWMVHQPVAYETRWIIVLFNINPPVVLTGCTINSRLRRNI